MEPSPGDQARRTADRSQEAKLTVATLAGWLGFTFGLLNVYPSFFLWAAPHDKILGILVCALVAAFAARVTYLAAENRLDYPMIAIVAGLLAAIAVEVIINS